MTVQELRDLLEDYEPTALVRFAGQPNYPMEYNLGHEVAYVEDVEDVGDVLYLSEARQVGYLPGHVSEQLGWS